MTTRVKKTPTKTELNESEANINNFRFRESETTDKESTGVRIERPEDCKEQDLSKEDHAERDYEEQESADIEESRIQSGNAALLAFETEVQIERLQQTEFFNANYLIWQNRHHPDVFGETAGDSGETEGFAINAISSTLSGSNRWLTIFPVANYLPLFSETKGE